MCSFGHTVPQRSRARWDAPVDGARYEIHTFSYVSNRKCGARAAVSRSASPALPISPALASFRRGAGPECAVFADRGFGASQVTLRKTGTARNRTNHMFNGESINASERGARSSRNGHLASCPMQATLSHRIAIQFARHHHRASIFASRRGKKVPSRSGFRPRWCCPPSIIGSTGWR